MMTEVPVYEVVKQWVPLINLAITVGVWVYTWLANRHKVTDQRITALEERFDEQLGTHAERLTRLEMRAKGAPTHEDLSKMHEKLNRVAESSSRMEGQLSSIQDTLRAFLSSVVGKGLS